MADLIASAALAGIVLTLVATLARTDSQVRRAQETRVRVLTLAENVIERLQNLDASVLSKESATKTLNATLRGENLGPVAFEMDVSDIPGEIGGRRAILKARESAERPPVVFLVRDFYFGNPAP